MPAANCLPGSVQALGLRSPSGDGSYHCPSWLTEKWCLWLISCGDNHKQEQQCSIVCSRHTPSRKQLIIMINKWYYFAVAATAVYTGCCANLNLCLSWLRHLCWWIVGWPKHGLQVGYIAGCSSALLMVNGSMSLSARSAGCLTERKGIGVSKSWAALRQSMHHVGRLRLCHSQLIRKRRLILDMIMCHRQWWVVDILQE